MDQPLFPDSVAVADLIERDRIRCVDAATLDEFLRGSGLRIVFFSGLDGRRTDGHDVAVALRELLTDYPQLPAAIVAVGDERSLMPRFRVAVLPSLVLVADGQVVELLPRVRNWTDYSRALARYLGPPTPGPTAKASS